MADDYDLPKGELMRGKKGLVMGVANHNSIAWGISAHAPCRNPWPWVRVSTKVRGGYNVMKVRNRNAGPALAPPLDRKSTRLNSSHLKLSRMPSSA